MLQLADTELLDDDENSELDVDIDPTAELTHELRELDDDDTTEEPEGFALKLIRLDELDEREELTDGLADDEYRELLELEARTLAFTDTLLDPEADSETLPEAADTLADSDPLIEPEAACATGGSATVLLATATAASHRLRWRQGCCDMSAPPLVAPLNDSPRRTKATGASIAPSTRSNY